MTGTSGSVQAQPSQPDEVLMQRFQTGDRNAFEELLKKYNGPIYQFALRRIRVPSVAEDIAQDAFVRVVLNAKDFKHESKFSTWLYTIARNLCIDHQRKLALRRHPSLDQSLGAEDGATLGELLPDVRQDVERSAHATELQSRISSALEALPDEQRESSFCGRSLEFRSRRLR
jgi:RNA polymerase sigma-70 factor, ECF subfamily